MPSAPETETRALEARLADLERARAARLLARKRLRWALGGALLAVAVALAAGATVIDLSARGLSPRSPIYWLVGLVGIAALPALYLALRSSTADDDPEGRLDIAELDEVIRHVKGDLVERRLVAPPQSLQIVESSGPDGGLSEAGPPRGSLGPMDGSK